jgi:DNA polymerase III alpha subunit
VLRQYHEGLICTSACLAGELARLLVRGFYEEAKEAALEYQAIFGEGNYYLELQDHGLADQRKVNQMLLRLSAETGIPLVATNDCHYTRAEDAEAHDVLLCLQTGKKLSDENRLRYEGGQYYVKSPEEMEALFPYAQQALENTGKIAERCDVTIEFGQYKLPRFAVPDGKTSWEYLQELSQMAMDLGLVGLMVESHCDPSCALSDAAQQLVPTDLIAMLESLVVRDSATEDERFNDTLRQLRAQIDLMDENLIFTLASRMKVSRQIGELKKQNSIAIVQPGRWDAVLEKVAASASAYGLDTAFVKRLFNLIHDASVAEQNK